MTSRKPHREKRRREDVKRGPLSDLEREEIDRLAAAMEHPTPGKIALRLNRLKSCVNWYMLTRGLLDRPRLYPRLDPYVINGRTIYPYRPEHDQRIEHLRRTNLRPREIAAIVSAEFGIPRNQHSVRVRLAVLASYSDDAEAA